MGSFRSEYPITGITLQRWQKTWIKQQKSMNFSGLVQEVLTEIIRQKDPVYFEMHATIVDNNIQRKDLVKNIVKQHPEIIPIKNLSMH